MSARHQFRFLRGRGFENRPGVHGWDPYQWSWWRFAWARSYRDWGLPDRRLFWHLFWLRGSNGGESNA